MTYNTDRRQEIAPGQESTDEVDANKEESNGGDSTQKDANGNSIAGQPVSQTPAFGAGFGFDPSAVGGFPGMGMGGDFNQMQMMMAMQNGMGAGAFGGFPIMGKFVPI
jgi:hypothetical protein